MSQDDSNNKISPADRLHQAQELVDAGYLSPNDLKELILGEAFQEELDKPRANIAKRIRNNKVQQLLSKHTRDLADIQFSWEIDEDDNVVESPTCPVIESVAATKKDKDDDGYTDAIHEALKKVSATLPPKSEKAKAAAGVQLPHQFSFDEWLMSGTGYGTPTPTEGAASKCLHDWQIYRGFHFDDYYCTKCGQTRPLDPSK